MTHYGKLGLADMLFLGLFVGACAAGAKQETKMSLKAVSTGTLKVNGTELWHEEYGQGEGAPLVVLHGGLMTIPEMMPVIEPLAKTRKVIALELQGHGRTPDTDRPLALSTLGDDVAAVLDKLEVEQADIAGYSFGADVALRTAIQHPNKVRRLIVISTAFAKRGWYPKAQEGMGSVSAALAGPMAGTPVGKLSRQWPEPERFPKFLDKLGAMMREDYDWTAEVKQLSMPTLLMYADHDSVSQQHIAEFFALLGGGITEPGWQNTQFTRARLAVIPGYSHYNFMSSTEIAPYIERFVRDPLAAPTSGALAAAQAAP